MNLEIFLSGLTKLRRGSTPYGLAPHKPILLLTILDQMNRGERANNKFFVDVDLVRNFHENWALYAPDGFQEDFTQPFYHLQNSIIAREPIWKIISTSGLSITTPIKSFRLLAEATRYAELSQEVFQLLLNNTNRELIKDFIIKRFFPWFTGLAEQQAKVAEYKNTVEGYVLNDIPATMRLRVAEEEMVYVRNWSFKNWVPKIYQNTCAISGMNVTTSKGQSIIDACHIIPFSNNQDDRVTNGIALCPNLHRAFDSGLVSIDQEYRVLVSDHLVEDRTHPYGLSLLKGKKIILPSEKHRWPNPENLEWHRKEKFLK